MTDYLFSKEETYQIFQIIKKNWHNEGSHTDLVIMEFLFAIERCYINNNQMDVENKIKEFFTYCDPYDDDAKNVTDFLEFIPEEIKNKITLIML